ncbi:MAG: hypothetical protein IKR25_05105 [Muribaculaceae bacterium]|nr:hypothetical protein [Muribaculaceae bacterium]
MAKNSSKPPATRHPQWWRMQRLCRSPNNYQMLNRSDFYLKIAVMLGFPKAVC